MRDCLFELRDGRQGIVDAQLDQASPGAYKQSVWRKSGAW
jgi:hypothetical protein